MSSDSIIGYKNIYIYMQIYTPYVRCGFMYASGCILEHKTNQPTNLTKLLTTIDGNGGWTDEMRVGERGK